MVKRLAIFGFIVVAVAAASMVWAGTYSESIPAPQPTVMPASVPACGPAGCAPAKVKMPPMKPKKLTTSIEVKVQYPQPPPPMWPQAMCGPGPAPIPVAVPMWKFIVPWPPFVYYLPVE